MTVSVASAATTATRISGAMTIAGTGDSIAAFNNNTVSDFVNLGGGGEQLQGWFHWANAQLGGRLHPQSWTGIGSQGIAAIAARFNTNMLSLSPLPDIIIIEGGINDLWNGLPAPPAGVNVANQIITLANSVISAGKTPVIMAITPYAGSDVPNANTALRTYVAATPKAYLCDTYSALVDVNTGGFQTQYTDEAAANPPNLHPNVAGCQVIGSILATLLAKLAAPNDQLAQTNTDYNSITVNPLLTGTAGTFFNSPSASGQIATSWLSFASEAGVFSKVARADGYGDWQQIDFSSASIKKATLYQQYADASALLVGHTYVLSCEIQGANWNDCQLLNLGLFPIPQTAFASALGGSVNAGSGVIATPTGSIVLKTPPLTIGAGANYTSFWVQMQVAMTSGTIRIGRMTLCETSPSYPFTRLIP